MISLLEFGVYALEAVGSITITLALLNVMDRIIGCIFPKKEDRGCELIECIPLSQDSAIRLDIIVVRHGDINYVAIARRPVRRARKEPSS